MSEESISGTGRRETEPTIRWQPKQIAFQQIPRDLAAGVIVHCDFSNLEERVLAMYDGNRDLAGATVYSLLYGGSPRKPLAMPELPRLDIPMDLETIQFLKPVQCIPVPESLSKARLAKTNPSKVPGPRGISAGTTKVSHRKREAARAKRRKRK